MREPELPTANPKSRPIAGTYLDQLSFRGRRIAIILLFDGLQLVFVEFLQTVCSAEISDPHTGAQLFKSRTSSLRRWMTVLTSNSWTVFCVSPQGKMSQSCMALVMLGHGPHREVFCTGADAMDHEGLDNSENHVNQE